MPSIGQRQGRARPTPPIASRTKAGTPTGVIVRGMNTGATVTDSRIDSMTGRPASRPSASSSRQPSRSRSSVARAARPRIAAAIVGIVPGAAHSKASRHSIASKLNLSQVEWTQVGA